MKKFFLTILFLSFPFIAWAGNSGNSSGFSWSEKAGWIHFSGEDAGVDYGLDISDDQVKGYVWSEKTGWLSLNCLNDLSCDTQPYGVVSDGEGNLSGYAWSEKGGWINFNGVGAVDYQVQVDIGGNLSGYAWSEKMGWVNMDDAGDYYGVQTGEREAYCENCGLGPVGYWTFDEGYGTTAHDESGQGNDGAISGATWQDESECVSGKCLWFDGNDDTVAISNSNFNFPISNQFSMSKWINFQTLATAKPIVSQWGNSQNTVLVKTDDTNSDELRICIASSLIDDCTNYGITTDTDISENTWNNLQVVYDGSQSTNATKLKLFINGKQKNLSFTGTIPTTITDSSEELEVGGDPDLLTYINGKIDEVKIYPYARTVDQIKQDYNAGLAGQSSSKGTSTAFGSSSDKWMSDGLVGHWKMDEASWNGTAGEVIDASGNGNHGVRNGDATTGGGKYGNGGTFDGVDDTVAISNFQFPISNQFSISQFLNVKTLATGKPIIGEWGGSQNNVLLKLDDTNSDELKICIADSLTDNCVNYGYTTDVNIATESWYNLQIIYNGNNIENSEKLKLYINGVEKTLSFSGTIPSIIQNSSTANLEIGGNSDLLAYSSAHIDETRIYNRVLSPAEIKKLYEWAPGPVAHWKMDEKVKGDAKIIADISGNGNNGTTVDGANNTGMDCTVRGKYGNACQFDGEDDYVEITNGGELNANDNITIEGWINPSAFTYNGEASGIFSKGSGYYQDYFLGLNSGELRFVIDGDWGGANDLNNTNGSISLNEWTHVAVVFSQNNDSSSTLKFYINGNLDLSHSLAISNLPNTSSNIRVGFRGSNYPFKGKIDDMRVYNYARTQKQILEDMHNGDPLKGTVLDLNFDEEVGDTAYSWTHSTGSGQASSEQVNGTLVPGTAGANTTTSAMWTKDGKLGGAMEFDGVDDYIEISTDSDGFNDFEAMSVSAWVYKSSISNRIIIASHSGGSYNWQLQTWGGSIRFGVRADGGYKYADHTASYPVDEYFHVIGVYDGKNVKAYINAEEMVGEAQTGNVNNSSMPCWIGARSNSGPQDVWDGLIDEVKVYPYALNDDEIKTLYNSSASIVVGEDASRDNSGTTVTGASKEYCIPGDTSQCDAPVLELKMDEKSGTTAYDTSGNGNNGTLNGGPVWDRGKNGSGLEFDGIDDTVSFPMFTGDQTNTFEFWAKPAIGVDGDDLTIMGRYNAGNNQIGFRNSASLQYRVNDVTYVSVGVSNIFDKWNHYSFVRSGTIISFYKNGINIGNEDIVTTTDVSIDRLGARSDSFFYKGMLDDVRIFDYARTPAQIAYDYNKGAPIAEWRMDEGEGLTVHDESGNGNDGTMTNMDASTDWVSGKRNKALDFDGVDDYVDIGDVNQNINGISFWVKATSTTESILDLDGGTHTISVSNGIISANGFSSPTIYVDGAESATLDNNWHHILVKTSTPIDANNIDIGRINTNYFDGLIDDVKIYNYTLTAEQVKNEYNGGALRFGE